ncbi:MAG: di-heme oxidoredictase family protein [Flavobacteriales bacterium]
MRIARSSWIILVPVLTAVGCSKFEPIAPADDALLDGPVEGLTGEQHAMFLRGDAAFNDAVFHSGNGLGPLFVATTCASCHAGDGRGHPFTSLVRFGQTDNSGNHWLDQGGPQLQHRAIPGHEAETLPAGAPSARLLPPPNTGLGLLEVVSDEDILSWADADDLDGDGISGVVNWIGMETYSTPRPGSVENAGRYVGRMGRKASVYDLLQQTANAYAQDIGVNSDLEPIDTYTHLPVDPEVALTTINDVVFYLRTLKAPIQRDRSEADVTAGEAVFVATGCAKCHRQEMITGPSPIAALAGKTIRPFSDLLLHDMGAGLDDGYTEGNALTAEWRTPPLWGLGLSPASQGGSYFLLHDGRATSIEQAIDLHGGEGAMSRTAFGALSSNERAQLIRFLESL